MLTLTDLNECFLQAKESGSRFIAVRINISGVSGEEVIINPNSNLDDKQEFYNSQYTHDLHRIGTNGVVKITGCAHADSFDQIQSELELYDKTGQLK